MSDDMDRNELRSYYRMLREIAELAQEATMTGALQEGSRAGVRRYNSVVRQLESSGVTPAGMFEPLPENTEFAELGVESRLLAGYIKERQQEPAPPQPSNHGPSGNIIVGLGGLKELVELKDLGRLVRQHLPEWMQGREDDAKPDERKETSPAAEATSLTELESRLAEVGARLQAAAEQLRRNDLGDEQRAQLAEQLSRLGQEQAGLARRHAEIRGAGAA